LTTAKEIGHGAVVKLITDCISFLYQL